MHATDSPRLFPAPAQLIRAAHSRVGFSLVEVTMAIGIIAFAFVALFGLLPSGLTTFRAAVDTTNDSSIMQDMNSMVQVTEWKKVDGLAQSKGGDIYYYDEEGRRTDTKSSPAKEEVVNRRLYQVKLIVEPFVQPGSSSKSSSDQLEGARRIIVVIGDLVRPKSVTDFEHTTKAEDLTKSAGQLDVRSRTFVVTRMESVKDDN
jgi:uncharacterized protein (TIGR02598 family)